MPVARVLLQYCEGRKRSSGHHESVPRVGAYGYTSFQLKPCRRPDSPEVYSGLLSLQFNSIILNQVSSAPYLEAVL